MHRNLSKSSNLLFGVRCISSAVPQTVKILASHCGATCSVQEECVTLMLVVKW